MVPWVRRSGRRLEGPWNLVDGRDATGIPYPVEANRYVYVTPYGGHSQDLDRGEVGLHEQALLENTELEAGDEVTVRVFEHGRPLPFVFRDTYVVVPLAFDRPDAWLHGTQGEAVLGPGDEVGSELPDTNAAVGDLHLVLNGVIARRLGGATI